VTCVDARGGRPGASLIADRNLGIGPAGTRTTWEDGSSRIYFYSRWLNADNLPYVNLYAYMLV